MDLKNQAKLKMFLAVRIFLLSNPAITAKMPNFDEFMAALDDAIAQIQLSDEQDVQRSKGISENKKLLRDSLIKQIVENSAKIQAYAMYIGDAVLMAETHYTLSKLKIMTEITLVSNAKSLHSNIQKNLAALASYGLNAGTQTNFMTVITTYEQSLPDYRKSQIISKDNTLTENKAFEKAEIALDHIDALVEMVRFSESSFYAGYKTARKIVIQGQGTLQVQGKVTDAVSGEPVTNATLTFTLEEQSTPALTKQTAAKGGFMIKNLSEGKYKVNISKIGYEPQMLVVVVSMDKTNTIDAALLRQ